MGLREQILGAADLRIEKVNVSEWGVNVFVRSWTGTQRDAWEKDWRDWREKQNGNDNDFRKFHAVLCIHSLVDEAGALIFTMADVQALSEKSARAIGTVARKSMRINGVGSDEAEELIKNSGGGPSAATGSDSPDTSA
jgi:hypothetical protein